VQSWDSIVVGGGIIGLSLAIALRRSGASVLVLERGEPGREASYAAAGMLASSDYDTPAPLHKLTHASAAMYPEFVRELEDSTDLNVDFHQQGTLCITELPESTLENSRLAPEEARRLEPSADFAGRHIYFLQNEQSVDPRLLTAAALTTARHLGVDVHSGTRVRELVIENGHVAGVRSDRSQYRSVSVANCGGAWAAELGDYLVPARPVKGQMLAVIPARRPLLRHVVRSQDVYILPRKDGRVLIGATVEEAGFDKTVQPQVIQKLHQAASSLIPELGEALIHEAWAGLRPGSPDNLPILGMTSLPGYFVATGHFRNGILLAPITAACMADLIQGRAPQVDLSPFAPQRFLPMKEMRA
jgi:glycine oxidase